VTSSPDNGLASEAYYHFADLVEEYTGGQVKVDVYPGSQLFPATEQWEAVSTGAVDIYADATYWFSSYVPDAMVSYIDGMWEGYEHAYAVLEDSVVPRMLADRIEAAGPVKVLGFLPGSAVMAVMNNVRETEQFEDLDGLKINSAPGTPPQPIYDYSGMVALPIALEEASTAFIQGVIDAVMYPPDTIARFRMYETGKHILYRTTMGKASPLTCKRSSSTRLCPILMTSTRSTTPRGKNLPWLLLNRTWRQYTGLRRRILRHLSNTL